MNTTNCVRYNTYFKGGRDDSFMFGTWIGDVLQQDTVFIMCDFNGVEADFERCTFIDCGIRPKEKTARTSLLTIMCVYVSVEG